MDDKIIELFNDNQRTVPDEASKFFQEFNYVRLNKDKNGNVFNAEHLRHYAETVSYLVTVMHEHDSHTWLYNYEVPQEKLGDFILKFKMEGVDGQIVDIERHLPENFA